jgi:hypothetical protein
MIDHPPALAAHRPAAQPAAVRRCNTCVRRSPVVLLPLMLAMLAACIGPAGSPTASRSGTPTSPGTPSATASEPAQVAALLARAMRLPSLAPGATCPRGTPTSRSPFVQPADATGFGTAPLYPIGMYMNYDATLHLRDTTPSPDGLYEVKVVWANVPYQGPVVVRVGRLDGPGRGLVRIHDTPDASVGDAVVFPLNGAVGDWPSSTFVSGPGCYGYQIDGAAFTEVVVFRVVQ